MSDPRSKIAQHVRNLDPARHVVLATAWLDRAIRARVGGALAAHGDAVAADLAVRSAPVDTRDLEPVLHLLGRIRRHGTHPGTAAAGDALERAVDALTALARARPERSADELLVVGELVRQAATVFGAGDDELRAQLVDVDGG